MPTLPGFELSEAPLDPSVLRGAELVLGLRLPEAFCAIAEKYDGAFGQSAFPVPGAKDQSSIGEWLSFRPWNRHSVWSWLGVWGEHELPPTVVPFAEDGGGNLMCLDYRAGAEPSVARWFHELSGEEGLWPVAPSFEAWLATVVADDEDEA